MLFQLESSIVSVRVFCCFSLGLLLFQSESSVCPPDGKVGIRVAEKFRFLRFTFKFQPKDNSIQSLLNLLHLNGLEPHLSPLSSQKNEMLIFGLHSTSVHQLDWSMDLNPICHPSPAKKWNAHFWITFNFWWSAGLVDGLEPHLPPLSSQKYEILIFGLRSTPVDWSGCLMDSKPICHPSPAKKMKCSFLDYVQLLMIGLAGRWTRTPSATPLQPKIWNAHFWITFMFWWSARLVNGLEPHLPPLSSQKYEMLIFGLHSYTDDRLG